MAIAVGATFLGFVIDAARGNELTSAFACLYLIGVVAAVVLVRYRGLFTASVQAPLILFVAVPMSYQYFTENPGTGLKDILLNVAIPLVNRFPLMLLGTVLALALAGARVFMKRQSSHAPAGAAKRSMRDRATETRDRAKQNRDRMRQNRARADEARPRRAAADATGRRDSGPRTGRDTGSRNGALRASQNAPMAPRSGRVDSTPSTESRRARREREQATSDRGRGRNRDRGGSRDRKRTTDRLTPNPHRSESTPTPDTSASPARPTSIPRPPSIPRPESTPRPQSTPRSPSTPRIQPTRAPRPPQVDPYSAPRAGAHIPPHPLPQVRYRDRGDA